jgi:hypothetical protein
VYLNSALSSEENVPGGHTRIVQDSGGASRLLNTLEEKLCREGTKDRVVEYSVELCQVGIEQVQVCTREPCFEFREKSVKEKTLQIC